MGQVVPLHGAATRNRLPGRDTARLAGQAPPADPTCIELSYHHQHLWSDTGADGPETWTVSAEVVPDVGDGQQVPPPGAAHVGDIQIVLVDPYEPDAYSALDGDSADLGRIGAVVLDLQDGGLAPDLDATLEGVDRDLLILNSVTLSAPWRGFGIGVLLAGLAIKRLSRGCSAAVCMPAPLPPLHDPVADRAAQARLSAVWSQLGFREFRDGVQVLDLALVTLDEALTPLGERIARYY